MRLSGRLRSAVIIGLQGIRARKMRTLLSMISLFMGVLAVVTVQAGANTAERALVANVELTSGIDGTRELYAPPVTGGSEAVLGAIRGRTDAVALTSVNAIIGEPNVTPVNPGGGPFDSVGEYGPFGPGRANIYCDQNGCYKQEDTSAPPPPGQAIELRLVAMTADVRQFRPFRPEAGEWLDFGSAPSMAPRLVLNKEAAKGFERYTVPAEMRITGSSHNPTPRIVGVIDDGLPMPQAYVRFDELTNWISTESVNNNGGLQLLMAPTAGDVEQIIKLRLGALGVPADQIYINTINSLEQAQTTLAVLRWVFLGLASIVLLIGVGGILNVGLATVGERIEEFALRRAVGTPRLLLAGIVLAETMLTGLFTAAAAIGVGAAAFRFAGPILASREPVLAYLSFPWQAGVAGVIAGLVAGLLGGLIPAVRAARIPIASVMRA